VEFGGGITIWSAATVGGEMKPDSKKEYVGKENNTTLPSVLQGE
jgi:hypothetical protein